MKKLLVCLCIAVVSSSNIGASKDTKGDYIEINRPPESSQVIINPTNLQQPNDTNLLLRETQLLKDELIKLRQDISEQKGLTSNLLNRIIQVVDNQNQLINISTQNGQLFESISTSTNSINQQLSFMDAVILDKTGMPYGFIEDGFKIYEYNNGNLLGTIGQNNEIIRNSDGSVVGIIEKDFIIDTTGHPIASVERSENLRWEREKLYAQVQKTPVSLFFIMNSPQPFNLNNFRFSTWSNQDLMSILYFDEGEVQKLK